MSGFVEEAFRQSSVDEAYGCHKEHAVLGKRQEASCGRNVGSGVDGESGKPAGMAA